MAISGTVKLVTFTPSNNPVNKLYKSICGLCSGELLLCSMLQWKHAVKGGATVYSA